MTVLSYEESKGETFLVLEPFEGEPLDSQIPAGEKMDPAEALALLRQLASALDYSHANGSIHGSLHPSASNPLERAAADQGARSGHHRSHRPPGFGGKAAARGPLSLSGMHPRPGDGWPQRSVFSGGAGAPYAHRGTAVSRHSPGCDVPHRLPGPGTGRHSRSASLRRRPSFSTITRQMRRPNDMPTAARWWRDWKTRSIRRPAGGDTPGRMFRNSVPPAPVARAPPAPRTGISRHLSGEAIKYFGITFAVVALILGGVFYLLLPKPPKPAATAAPVVAQPAAPSSGGSRLPPLGRAVAATPEPLRRRPSRNLGARPRRKSRK